jgi:hypothetical protein
MGPIYQALGLSVGVIQHEASFLYDPVFVTSDIRLTSLRPCTRQEAYRADKHEVIFRVFQDYFLRETDTLDYTSVAAHHRISVEDVANYLKQAKRRFRELLEELVSETVDNRSDLQEEMRALFGDASP